VLLDVRGRAPTVPSRWNKDITPAVDAIVLKLLAPDPAQRYATAAELREDLERHLAHKPLAHAPNTSVAERGRKWRRRNPRLATALAAGFAALVLLVLPATAIAIRQVQLTKRQLVVQRDEALVNGLKALDELQDAQILLSSQTGDTALMDDGFALGKQVLKSYDVGPNASWREQPMLALLPPAKRQELEKQLGELLLLFSRGELIKASPNDSAAMRSALEWNRLAETCFAHDQRPEWLARQRQELLERSPGAAASEALHGLVCSRRLPRWRGTAERGGGGLHCVRGP
jgi:hypothetical protein